MGETVWADSHPANIKWHQWEVGSNDGWSVDTNPDIQMQHSPAYLLQHPMTYLFDGHPTTTWVYADANFKASAKGSAFWGDKCRALWLSTEHPVVIDSIRLMNGDNESAAAYPRHDRIIRMELAINGKAIKEVALADEMGWHKVSFPRQRVGSIRLDFTGIRKGAKPNSNICISEIELLNRGRKIDMRMPRAAVFVVPGCCGTGQNYLLSRNGRVLATGEYGEGLDVEWNQNSSLVAGVDLNGIKTQLWVADLSQGRVVLRARLKGGNVSRLMWRSRHTIEVIFYGPVDEKGNNKVVAKQIFKVT